MFQFAEIADALLMDALKSIITSAIGFLVARLIVAKFEQWRHGGWCVSVIAANGAEVARRTVGVAKAKAIFDDDADMSVFVKGVASPYGWLNCDPVTTGQEIGLFYIGRRNRELVIDLRKNPQKNGR